MTTRRARRLLAAAIALAAILPVAAGRRPACCATEPAAPVPPCCKPASGTGPAEAGCCKSPLAPKPDTTAKTAAPATSAIVVETPVAGASGVVVALLPEIVAVRLSRHAHRSASPDDSPPDRLARLHILRI
jgi:hypothetical protein